MHEVCLDVCESGILQQGFEFDFAESEPGIGIELARFFEAVLHQIEDGDAAAGFENPPGFADGAPGMQRVMQRLAEECQIDRAVFDGTDSRSPSRYSSALTPCFSASDVPNSTIFSELSTAITFFARCASSSENVPSPAPRSAITIGGISFNSASERPFHERPGTYSLPNRPAISSKKRPALVLALAQRELQRGLVLSGLGDLRGSLANHRQHVVRGGLLQAIEIVFPGSPILDQASAFQLRELGGYGALP